MMKAPDLICIVGPTASGKTALAAEIAKKVSGEVVSADSMQIYRGMDIATAKPDEAEKQGVPHHMLDILEPGEEYSVKRYVEDASLCIEDIKKRGGVPIVCGGTGLYIDSLLKGRDFAKGIEDKSLRENLINRAEDEGGAKLLRELSEFDPESAARLHENDIKRIVRAIEVYSLTGKTISEHNKFSKTLPPRYTSVKIGLSFSDRAELYERINLRVDEMLKKGLIEEARRLFEAGKLKGTALQAIGYKELLRAFNGECTTDEAADKLKTETRRYAKRQITWFSRDDEIKWVIREKRDTFERIFQISMDYLNAAGIESL
ncbi:MAG: tRNA (adenosine(37)-N6)-dimethylallyltransferase MiaA [Bacillota bacterium]|nr:tRNA (adenosine(37)-N6)-dimethylallyltransferase MiaA [Bacillota bacterium]